MNGVTAGGDLSGTFPSPSIANGAVTAAKVAANSLTGARIDESSLGTVPDAAKLGGLGASSYEQPQMARLSITSSNSADSNAIITLGGLNVFGLCASNAGAGINNGAAVTVGLVGGAGSADVWEEHGGVADFQTITNSNFDSGSPNLLLGTGPQVFTYEGVDNAGKLFHITAGSRYNAGTCTFVAWGSSQP